LVKTKAAKLCHIVKDLTSYFFEKKTLSRFFLKNAKYGNYLNVNVNMGTNMAPRTAAQLEIGKECDSFIIKSSEYGKYFATPSNDQRVQFIRGCGENQPK